jgi:hypothetical protein
MYDKEIFSKIFCSVIVLYRNQDCSFSIAVGYGLDAQGIGVQFPIRARDFSFLHGVQTRTGAHPASYKMGTRGFSPGGKVVGV